MSLYSSEHVFSVQRRAAQESPGAISETCDGYKPRGDADKKIAMSTHVRTEAAQGTDVFVEDPMEKSHF